MTIDERLEGPGEVVTFDYTHDPPYDSPWVHDVMLSDEKRTNAYRQAIQAHVQPGDTVMDLGTGTGIFAFFAAQAGADKVYAVDPSDMIKTAEAIAEDNNLEDRIEFIQARAEDVSLPERVDWLISEWIGVSVFQENMLPALIDARDKFLKEDGGMLPSRVDLYLAPVDCPEAYQTVTKWKSSPYGIDMQIFAELQANNEHVYNFEPNDLLAPEKRVLGMDMKTVEPEPSYEASADFTIDSDGELHGLASWFQACFGEEITLDTSPYSPPTSWEQAYFPVEESVKVRKGDEISVDFKAVPDSEDEKLIQFHKNITYS